MGEMAEYIINGDDCQECGEYIGPGDGFPRSCAGCKPREPAKTYGKKSLPYMCIAGRKKPVHIMNPTTKRTYCQAENNATWPMFMEKEIPHGRKLCQNCSTMHEAAQSLNGAAK